MHQVALEELRSANGRLRTLFLRLQGVESGAAPISARELSALRAQMKLVVKEWRRRPVDSADAASSAALRAQFGEYREQLQQLRQLLPTIQVRLLVEKARLEARRTHLMAAAAWAQASSETL